MILSSISSAEAAKCRCGPAPNAGHPAKLEKTTAVGALKASQQEKKAEVVLAHLSSGEGLQAEAGGAKKSPEKEREEKKL